MTENGLYVLYAHRPGARVKVEINEGVEIAGQGPLGWHLLDCSPFNPR